MLYDALNLARKQHCLAEGTGLCRRDPLSVESVPVEVVADLGRVLFGLLVTADTGPLLLGYERVIFLLGLLNKRDDSLQSVFKRVAVSLDLLLAVLP